MSGVVTIAMVVRMRALWDANLSYAAIATVVALDWGAPITEHHVRWHLRFHARGTDGRGGARRGVAGMSKVSGRRFGAADMSAGVPS